MRNGNLAGLMAIGLRLGAVVAASGMGVVALSEQALALANWQFDAGSTQLVISLPKGVRPSYYLMAEPARIVLDLPNTEVGAVATEQTYSGAVRQIRVAQFQPSLARIVMELSPEAVLAPGQVELKQIQGSTNGTQRWMLRPLLVGAAPVTSPAVTNPVAQAAAPTASTAPTASPLPPLEPGAIEIPVEAATQPAVQPSPADTASRVAAAPAPSSVQAANSSIPMQVDFSTPLPATSAELSTADGSAAALSLPSVRLPSASQSASPRPVVPASSALSGARSFPVPTADGISVPALSTVTASTTAVPTATAPAALAPAQPLAQSATAQSATAQPRATTSVAFGQPVPGIAQPQQAVPSAQTAAARPRQTAPGAIQVITFGQPLPQ